MRTEDNGIVRFFGILTLGALLVIAPGCPEREGPLERAGEEIDDSVEDIGEEVDEATE
jgi:hypothetical protein